MDSSIVLFVVVLSTVSGQIRAYRRFVSIVLLWIRPLAAWLYDRFDSSIGFVH